MFGTQKQRIDSKRCANILFVFSLVHIVWYLLSNAIAIYIYIYIYIIPISGWLAQVKPHIG